jgi:hypothetical protein
VRKWLLFFLLVFAFQSAAWPPGGVERWDLPTYPDLRNLNFSRLSPGVGYAHELGVPPAAVRIRFGPFETKQLEQALRAVGIVAAIGTTTYAYTTDIFIPGGPIPTHLSDPLFLTFLMAGGAMTLFRYSTLLSSLSHYDMTASFETLSRLTATAEVTEAIRSISDTLGGQGRLPIRVVEQNGSEHYFFSARRYRDLWEGNPLDSVLVDPNRYFQFFRYRTTAFPRSTSVVEERIPVLTREGNEVESSFMQRAFMAHPFYRVVIALSRVPVPI